MWADSSGPPTEPEEKGEASLTSPMRRYGEGEHALLGAGGGTTVSQATFDMKGNCGYNLPHQELASYVPGGGGAKSGLLPVFFGNSCSNTALSICLRIGRFRA